MRDYDELDEERDLKRIKPKSEVNEYGDRVSKSDVYAGILIMLTAVAWVVCGSITGCKYIKKKIAQNKTPAAQVMTNSVQRSHISVHDCR